jgi:uncharacterized membrane protein (UPF0127 family)
MRYPIDVLFLDPQDQVLERATLAPWRLSRFVLSAASVLELPAGTLAQTAIDKGDRVVIKPI